jgi:hypothetical protein
MRPRLSDPRLGHFMESFTDLSGDLKANPRVHYVKRWRLEKKDPAAALSEPVQPIVYWLDKNIPASIAPSVKAGVTRVEQGLRAHRLQERRGRQAAARRRQVGQHGRRAMRRSAGSSAPTWALPLAPATDPRSGEIWMPTSA